MSVLLIGNSGIKHNLNDGQTVKLRLFRKKIQDERIEMTFVDLENFFHRPFSILSKIKKGIKGCDRIVLVSGERACRLLIPFINRHNKNKKPFILPLIGIGVLHFAIDNLSNEQKNQFLFNKEYSLGKSNKKLERELNKVTYILPETELLADTYSNFYHLSNCVVLNNFRDYKDISEEFPNNGTPKFIYASRVIESKGIMDLIEAANTVKEDFKLDIYGEIGLNEENKKIFNSLSNSKIQYCGVILNKDVFETLKKYDMLVFPTKYYGEGTPGIISESLIVGTPVLSSKFVQVANLLKDNYDSIQFEINNSKDLKDKFVFAIKNIETVRSLRENAKESGLKFTYNYEREKFLKYICGVEEQ